MARLSYFRSVAGAPPRGMARLEPARVRVWPVSATVEENYAGAVSTPHLAFEAPRQEAADHILTQKTASVRDASATVFEKDAVTPVRLQTAPSERGEEASREGVVAAVERKPAPVSHANTPAAIAPDAFGSATRVSGEWSSPSNAGVVQHNVQPGRPRDDGHAIRNIERPPNPAAGDRRDGEPTSSRKSGSVKLAVPPPLPHRAASASAPPVTRNSIHIGAVDIHIAPPPRAAVVAAPVARRTATPAGPSMARGFVSPIGLPQG